jgi:hypothetical protein
MPDLTADDRVLDRRIPTDWVHVDRHPLRVAAFVSVPPQIEVILNIPRQYRDEYDQGQVSGCVGASQSWMMSIRNRKLYDWTRLYYEAQGRDEWAETPPEGGTSLRAGFDVLRLIGHWRVYAGKTRAPRLEEGIEANQWARSIYEIRASIYAGLPVNFGINWYRQFSSPVKKARLDDLGKPLSQFGYPRFDYWIGVSDVDWGSIDGGHAITCVGVSDRREAVALCNTWGEAYPFLVWLPYRSVERLLSEAGEAGVIVDRVKAPDAER